MRKLKIARVVGARPQFMQVPPMRDALVSVGHTHVLIHTGQHYDTAMSDAFFGDLELPAPDHMLGAGTGTHGEATGRMLERLESVLIDLRPDLVLVDGDTNSTLAAALAAVKLHIPICHIEAGLRDFDLRRPEEVNRVMTDHASDINAAPVPRALANLVREGLGARSILSGDVLLDCFLRYRERRSKRVRHELGLQRGAYHVLTLHRPENTDLKEHERFREIMAVLTALDKPVVFPLHPRTKPMLKWYSAQNDLAAVRPITPVSYLEMLGLVDGCDCVFTDSGGLPREAAWAGRRCVMLHRIEVWHDLLENGWVQIGMTDRSSIVTALNRAKAPDIAATRAAFGNGQASLRIIEEIAARFG